MNEWYELTMFARIMFVVGCMASFAIVVTICGLALYVVDSKLDNRTAKRKAKAAKPIDGIDYITYDSKGSIKQQGHELREICYRGKK